MPLFEVAIIEKPTEEAAKTGATERLVFGPTAIIAKDKTAAAVIAGGIGFDEDDVNESRIEVLVRPFV